MTESGVLTLANEDGSTVVIQTLADAERLHAALSKFLGREAVPADAAAAKPLHGRRATVSKFHTIASVVRMAVTSTSAGLSYLKSKDPAMAAELDEILVKIVAFCALHNVQTIPNNSRRKMIISDIFVHFLNEVKPRREDRRGFVAALYANMCAGCRSKSPSLIFRPEIPSELLGAPETLDEILDAIRIAQQGTRVCRGTKRAKEGEEIGEIGDDAESEDSLEDAAPRSPGSALPPASSRRRVVS